MATQTFTLKDMLEIRDINIPIKKSYTLEDMLKALKFRHPIKDTYTLPELVSSKPNLSSSYNFGGACMIYDSCFYAKDVRRLNKLLAKKNMCLVAPKHGWAKVVRIDDKVDLPKDYFEYAESLIGECMVKP